MRFGDTDEPATAAYRTDRAQPQPQTTQHPDRVIDPSSLGAGDRFQILKPLADTADGHAGATGTVLWTDGSSPCVQLDDGTVLNLIEDDCIEYARSEAKRGTVQLITISHDRTMWNEGFDRHDVYLQFPLIGSARGLEADIRMLVDAHNKAQAAFDRDFEVSVRLGAWEGPDLGADDARKIIFEALNEWQGI